MIEGELTMPLAIIDVDYDEFCAASYRGITVCITASGREIEMRVSSGSPVSDMEFVADYIDKGFPGIMILNRSSVDHFLMDGGELTRSKP